MNFVKVLLATFLIAATGATGVLFLHTREREARAHELRQTISDLQQNRDVLKESAKADETAQRSTGLYEVQELPLPGFRPMEFAVPGTKAPAHVLYVSLVPDLGLEDITAAHLEERGLRVQLTAAGQARLRVFSRSRTTGGKVAREAIVVDGRVVEVPVFRNEIQTDTFVIGGTAAMSSAWAEKLLDEINAPQKR